MEQDEGYVDEEASLGNTIKRLFGMGKSSKPTYIPPSSSDKKSQGGKPGGKK